MGETVSRDAKARRSYGTTSKSKKKTSVRKLQDKASAAVSPRAGNPKAAFELGVLCEERHNTLAALRWLKQGSSKGGQALARWACLFYMNSLNSQDESRALEALDKAIGQGYASGYQDLARRLEAAGKKEKAATFMKKILPSN